jgi:hypothetical protein
MKTELNSPMSPMRTNKGKNVMSGLVVIGLLLCGNVRGQIALQDGSTNLVANGEPFLNPAASSNSVSNGWVLRFGGIPRQTYVLQTAPAVAGPWSILSEPVNADLTGMTQFTDTTPALAKRFYRTREQAPIYWPKSSKA